MLSNLLAMAGFAFVGAITPGPVNVLALRHGSRGPRALALLYVLGASLSYAAVLAGMGLGAQGLLGRWPGVMQAAPWLCAAYLLWLAWHIARAPVGRAAAADGHADAGAWRVFAQGAAVQALNPKAWLVALSAIGVFVLPHGAQAGAALWALCITSLLACLLGVGCWALLGRALVRWLDSPTRHKALNRTLAALLAASVIGVLA